MIWKTVWTIRIYGVNLLVRNNEVHTQISACGRIDIPHPAYHDHNSACDTKPQLVQHKLLLVGCSRRRHIDAAIIACLMCIHGVVTHQWSLPIQNLVLSH
ncbi:hypothetical protein Tco_1333066 [Tanacetum coccineum]